MRRTIANLPIFPPPASWPEMARFLQQGTLTQQAAARVLHDLNIFQILAPFHPRLAGTIPLDVDLPGSDLDIICQAQDLHALAEGVETHFGSMPGFRLRHKIREGEPVLIAEFEHEGFPIQIYGSKTPVDQQRAWVHMVAEAYLLDQAGPEARAAVRALKAAGLKTEPAFAQVFQLPGDPYEVLYQLGATGGSPHQLSIGHGSFAVRPA